MKNRSICLLAAIASAAPLVGCCAHNKTKPPPAAADGASKEADPTPNATFTVQAVGSAPLYYQWRIDTNRGDVLIAPVAPAK